MGPNGHPPRQQAARPPAYPRATPHPPTPFATHLQNTGQLPVQVSQALLRVLGSLGPIVLSSPSKPISSSTAAPPATTATSACSLDSQGLHARPAPSPARRRGQGRRQEKGLGGVSQAEEEEGKGEEEGCPHADAGGHCWMGRRVAALLALMRGSLERRPLALVRDLAVDKLCGKGWRVCECGCLRCVGLNHNAKRAKSSPSANEHMARQRRLFFACFLISRPTTQSQAVLHHHHHEDNARNKVMHLGVR